MAKGALGVVGRALGEAGPLGVGVGAAPQLGGRSLGEDAMGGAFPLAKGGAFPLAKGGVQGPEPATNAACPVGLSEEAAPEPVAVASPDLLPGHTGGGGRWGEGGSGGGGEV